MENKLKIIQSEILRLIEASPVKNWESAEFVIDFPPYTNPGFATSQVAKDAKGNGFLLFKVDEAFKTVLLEFIKLNNQDGKYNRIVFTIDKGTFPLGNISIMFSDEVQNKFLSAIPKSQRDKIVPWYKN